ncbi:MAG TPA: GHKL domain-containing protein [Firmicutes bacterium]|nr:GHKL domain-containing protein [Bacillota bacterium]
MILIGVISASVVLISDCLRDVCYFYVGPGNEVLVGVFIILVNLLLVPLGLLINRFNLNRFISIPRKNTVLIIISCFIVMIFVATSLVVQTVFNDDGRSAVRIILAIIGVALLSIHLLNYLNLYFICERSDSELELQAQNKIMQANADMLNLTDRNLKDIRTFMHDAENRYAYMAELFKRGEYEELKKYLESITRNHLESLSIIDCGNRMVSNILNMEKGKADACGVKFLTSLNVPPVLPFDEVMFCSLLTNMIDNAIEACNRNNIENGEVRINISIMQEYLFIQVINPIPHNADKESLLSLNTEKSDVNNHGYGTKIIRQIAAKFNGHAMFSVEEDKFIAEAMLDLFFDKKRK